MRNEQKFVDYFKSLPNVEKMKIVVEAMKFKKVVKPWSKQIATATEIYIKEKEAA